MNTTNHDWGFFIDIENIEYHNESEFDNLIIYEYKKQRQIQRQIQTQIQRLKQRHIQRLKQRQHPTPSQFLNIILIVFKVITTTIVIFGIVYLVFYVL
jgi:hypothetical protein